MFVKPRPPRRLHSQDALNLKATGADGVMVAEELLRDPSLFAPEKISAPALIGAYLDLLRECDIPREDGSVSGCVEINQSVGLS